MQKIPEDHEEDDVGYGQKSGRAEGAVKKLVNAPAEAQAEAKGNSGKWR